MTGREQLAAGWAPRSWELDEFHDLELPGERVVLRLSAPILGQFFMDVFAVCEVEDRPADVVVRSFYVEVQPDTIPPIDLRLPDFLATGVPLTDLLREAREAAVPHLKERVAEERDKATQKSLDDLRAALNDDSSPYFGPPHLRSKNRVPNAFLRLRDDLVADPSRSGDPIEQIREAFPQYSSAEIQAFIVRGEEAWRETEALIDQLYEMRRGDPKESQD